MAGTTTVRAAIENATALPPGMTAAHVRRVMAWKRQAGGTWWPHMDIWNATTERDNVSRPRRTHRTSGSYSR
ncbi:MAG: hypothetical protein ACRDJE_02890 [Dehalococcoidia bacterium]